MKKHTIFLRAGLLFLAASAVIGMLGISAARAADFVGPQKNDSPTKSQVIVPRDETHANLYVAGGDVTVNSTTTGDLYVAGGTVTVDGPVAQDIVVAGGTVVINQPVGGDIRVFAGKVTVNNSVAGDILAFSGTLTLSDKSSVAGQVNAAAQEIVFDGPITGAVKIMGSLVTLNSKMAGSVQVKATEKLHVGPRAESAQAIAYTGKTEADLDSNAKASVTFTQLDTKNSENHKSAPAAIIAWLVGSFILHFLALGVATIILVYVFRKPVTAVAQVVRVSPWKSLGLGFVFLILMPIGAIIALFSLIGFYVSAAVFVLYAILLLVAGLIATAFVGAWVIQMLTKKPTLVLDWQAVVLGTAIMVLLPLIPVVGGLLDCMLTLMAFGALVTTSWNAARSKPALEVHHEHEA